MAGSSKVFYGFVIIAISIPILMMLHGAHASYGVFLTSFQEEFGWDRAAISAGKSLAFIVMGLSAAFIGPLTDKFGPKRMMTVSGIIVGAGLVSLSQINSLWQLYMIYGLLVGIGISYGDLVLLSTLARWFARRRSLMTGIMKSGTGLGILTIPLLAGWLIIDYNWRTALIVLGISAAIIIIFLSRWLKRDPSEIGLRPFGVPNGTISDDKMSLGLSSRESRHTWQFWIVMLIYFFIWYTTESIAVHIAPHAVDSGLSVAKAASLLAVIGGASTAGRLAMGGLADRITNRRTIAVSLGLLTASLIWLQFVVSQWMLYPFALAFGFAQGGFFALHAPLMAEVFGIKALASNLGALFLLGQLGGALGPVITGLFFDVTGNYTGAFTVAIILAVAAFALTVVLRPAERNGRQVDS